ncbi:unnamed protein product, partial [marine sediment metagenome]
SISLGKDSTADGVDGIAIGTNADLNNAVAGIAIGLDSSAWNDDSIAIGNAAFAPGNGLQIKVNESGTAATLELSAGGILTLDGTTPKLNVPLPLNTQTGTTYGAVLTDSQEMITMNNASPNTVTIPANASVAYPIGTMLNFQQLGAGATTIAITTDTLNVNASLTLVLNGQYAVATAMKMTATTWTLFGNLVAA